MKYRPKGENAEENKEDENLENKDERK